MSPNDEKILSMDADDAQAECSCVISSTSPSGEAAYFRPFHQVTGLMLPTLKKDAGKGSDRLWNLLLTCQFEGFKIPHCFLFKCCSFAIILFLIIYKKNSKKTGRDRFLPKHWKKWKKHISSRTEETGFFHGRNRPSEETANPAEGCFLRVWLSKMTPRRPPG